MNAGRGAFAGVRSMSILGIDRITYGVEDVAKCRQFFLDWGLKLVRESDASLDFETLNGCEVHLRHVEDATLPPAIENGPTVREVVWGVGRTDDLDRLRRALGTEGHYAERFGTLHAADPNEIGRASWREREETRRGAARMDIDQ